MKKLLLSVLTLSTAVMNAYSAQESGTPACPLPFKVNPNLEFVDPTPASRGASNVEDLGIIMDPQGTAVDYTQYGIGISNTQGGLTNGTMEGATWMVYSDNNKVYIANPLGAFHYGFAEGTLSADGKTIRVQLPQPIAAMRDASDLNTPVYYPVTLSIMTLDATPEMLAEGSANYVAETDPEKNYIEYSVDDKGVITQTYPYQADFEYVDNNGWQMPQFPEKWLSCYLTVTRRLQEGIDDDTEKDYWFGYANLNQKFTPLPDDLVYYEIPEDLEWNGDWCLTGGYSPVLVNGAIKDNKIYFKGIGFATADAVIVGEIEGDKVIFKNRQYLGVFQGRYSILSTVTYKEELNEWGYPTTVFTPINEDAVMKYDAAAQTLVQEGEDKGILINGSLEDVFSFGYACNASFRLQTTELLSAAPENPGEPMWSDYSEWYEGYRYSLYFNFPNTNVNGALLNANNMSYRVFFNHEEDPFIFDATEYELAEDMEWLPTTWVAANQYICGYGNSAQVLFFETGYTAVGVQTRNSAPDGKEYLSDIVWLDIPDAGIENVVNDKAVASETMYDITGRRVINPAAGQLVIKVTRFTDGTTKTDKVVF